jgi:hypothetical protein
LGNADKSNGESPYDLYLEAFARALELGKKLKEVADSDWLAANPGGMEGRYVAFSATNGVVQWVLPKKKPKSAPLGKFPSEHGPGSSVLF